MKNIIFGILKTTGIIIFIISCLIIISVIISAIQEDVSGYQNHQVLVIYKSGQAHTYNYDYSKGVKIKHTGNKSIIFFDNGSRREFPRGEVEIWEFAEGDRRSNKKEGAE